MSNKGFLTSARTQAEMAIIQGGIANQTAYEHARQGCDPGLAAKHGATVGSAVLAWWMFVLIPCMFFTLFVVYMESTIYTVWLAGSWVGAVMLWRRLHHFRHRHPAVRSPYRLSGGFLSVLWTLWFLGIWPFAIIRAMVIS